VFKLILCHEYVHKTICTFSRTLRFGTQLHVPAALMYERSPEYPLDEGSRGGNRSRSWMPWKSGKPLAPLLHYPASSLISTTELSRHLHLQVWEEKSELKLIVNDIPEGIPNKRGDFYGNLKHWITESRRATKPDAGAETLCNISTHVCTNSSDMYATKKRSPRHE
jgi:hypothetical protein